MSIKLQLPKLTELKPRITVMGIGGAGGNAVNNMISSNLEGVEFVVANTDAQALAMSSAEHRIQLGISLTEGLGAGSKPEIGEAAAEEAADEIRQQLSGSHMCFIAAGMGGGTGTGAASVVARVAQELGVLTVAVVTKPFQFEGSRRMRVAEAGIDELRKYVDTLIVIPNQNLFRIASDKTTFAEAFQLADRVLHSGVACIVDLIVREGLINLDFADVRTVMTGMGTAMMGTGQAIGERRAIEAAEAAIHNPLLDEVSLRGARGLLLSITGGRDLTLYEVDEAASRVREEVDPEANIIVGATFDDSLKDAVRVSIVATGLEPRRSDASTPRSRETREPERGPPPDPHHPEAHPYAYAFPPAGEQPQLQPLQPEAQPPARPGESVRKRLSDAMRGPQEPAYEPEDAQTMARPNAYRDGVEIEDAAPELPSLSNRPFATGEPPLNRPVQHARGFRPAPPQEVREPVRRMPSIDEFPKPAQRIYNARQNSGVGEEEGSRKPGFFQRWTGGRSRKGGTQDGVDSRADSRITSLEDRAGSYDQLDPQPVAAAAKKPTASGPNESDRSRRSPSSGDRQGRNDGVEENREDSETPMFFRSTKK
ncbi:MAG: cell division protein FtsZ [Hyphomicrobiaceae bacterium]|nr:MAG: cell division protein FtsZ [Hyphomicrobiaceae bacterium]